MRITSSMLHTLGGTRTNSIRNSWNGNSARRANGLSSNSLRSKTNSKTDTSGVYQTTQKAAANVRTQAEKLTDTGEDSVWEKAQKSGKNQDILAAVNEFVSSYNDMTAGMKKTGGSLNNIYRAQLTGAVTSSQGVLKEIGITANRDGTLSIDQDKLKAAGLEELKQAFGGSSSFAGQAAVKSIYVEANAVSAMSQQSGAAYMGYNNYGGFQNYGSMGANLGNYFNSLY